MAAVWKTALASLALAASGSEAAGHRERPEWMIGEWGETNPDGTHPEFCPHSDFFGRNGYVTNLELGGVSRWWIEGDVLVEITVEPAGGEDESMIGQVNRTSFRRLGNGDLLYYGPDWSMRMYRCGDVPPAWEVRPKGDG